MRMPTDSVSVALYTNHTCQQTTSDDVHLPSLIVIQVGKQHVLRDGFGQGSHCLVVLWNDL